jgi:hypothetical protein
VFSDPEANYFEFGCGLSSFMSFVNDRLAVVRPTDADERVVALRLDHATAPLTRLQSHRWSGSKAEGNQPERTRTPGERAPPQRSVSRPQGPAAQVRLIVSGVGQPKVRGSRCSPAGTTTRLSPTARTSPANSRPPRPGWSTKHWSTTSSRYDGDYFLVLPGIREPDDWYARALLT